jgi:hypothetical protein
VLFVNNFTPGDERRILEAIELPGDADELHWLLYDLLDVIEKNATAAWYRLAVTAYALTPCARCRLRAARALVEQQAAPGWLLEECRDDADQDCRELAAPAAIVTKPD